MHNVIELNLEKDFPPADVAVFYLEREITYAKSMQIGAIKVIHGYGSNGKGGEIKKAVHKKLAELQKLNVIKGFVKGECWGKESFEKFDVTNICPALIVDDEMFFNNSGLTIVFV